MARREEYRERILRVLVHVQRHLDDELALLRLADLAGFPPFHFHRIFSGMVGNPSWTTYADCATSAPHGSSCTRRSR